MYVLPLKGSTRFVRILRSLEYFKHFFKSAKYTGFLTSHWHVNDKSCNLSQPANSNIVYVLWFHICKAVSRELSHWCLCSLRLWELSKFMQRGCRANYYITTLKCCIVLFPSSSSSSKTARQNKNHNSARARREREKERRWMKGMNDWMNKCYFTRVVGDARGLYYLHPSPIMEKREIQWSTICTE